MNAAKHRNLATSRHAWPLWAIVTMVIMLALAIGWHVSALLDWSGRSPFDFDARSFYIPFAQRLLNDGWRFLLTPEAIKVPPFSFVFPALFGADLEVQKHIGIGMSAFVVLLLFRTGWLLRSPAAGLVCALLYALSPVPLPFMCTGSVEPLFIFLLATWAWAMAEGMAGRHWGFVLAGIAIGLASLTRATLLYYLPLVMAASMIASRMQPSERTAWRGISITHAIGFSMVVPFLLRNFIVFGLPAISTGAGVALYNGHHPLTWGFDPGYFGVAFDFGILGRQGAGHLDLDTDRVLLGAARRVIASYDLLYLAQLYGVKLASFLFVSNLEWVAPFAELRSWRVLLVCLSLASFSTLRRAPVLIVITGSMLFQIAVHMPVLYSHRYSVATLDVPLSLLAGIGLANIVVDWSWRARATAAALTWSAVSVGLVAADAPQLLQANVEQTPHHTILERDRDHLQLKVASGALMTAPGRIRTTNGIAEIDIDFTDAPIEAGRTYILALDASLDLPTNRPASCTVVYLYRWGDEAFTRERGIATRWATDGRQRRIYNGVSEHMHVEQPGWLRMQFHCGAGATIDINRIALVQPYFSLDVLRTHFTARGVLKPD